MLISTACSGIITHPMWLKTPIFVLYIPIPTHTLSLSLSLDYGVAVNAVTNYDFSWNAVLCFLVIVSVHELFSLKEYHENNGDIKAMPWLFLALYDDFRSSHFKIIIDEDGSAD